MKDLPVIVVGGSLVGLCASVFLAWRGVPHLLIEKHPQSHAHPRAMGFTERTLEYFRIVGLGDQVPQAAPGVRLRRVQAQSLFGDWLSESLWTPGAPQASEELSPCRGAAIAQDRLEPILRDRARELGAELWLGWEVLAFSQDADGVTLRVQHRESGQQQLLRTRYLIGADGAKSPIREQLGISRDGCGMLNTISSVLFYCPEADTVLAKGVQQFEIQQEGLQAFLTSYGDSRWVLMFYDDKDRSDPELAEAIRQALGQDLPFEILTKGRWQLAGLIARHYQQGRVFLAGDAAHQLPPTRGGFGANTGIEDAFNLCWKLAWVLKGHSAETLLDSYSAERQPIGWLRYQQTFVRPDYAKHLKGQALDCPVLSDQAMEFGQLHRSGAVLGAGAELPSACHPSDWGGQPGVRAPHLWLAQGQSSLDWFGDGFVLVAKDERWRDIAATVALRLGLPLPCVGTELDLPTQERLGEAFGIDSGAALVRPDGIVAWRVPQMPADAVRVLGQAWAQAASLH